MSICQLFHKTPNINPYTGRSILIGGPTYKKLVSECGTPPSTINNPNKLSNKSPLQRSNQKPNRIPKQNPISSQIPKPHQIPKPNQKPLLSQRPSQSPKIQKPSKITSFTDFSKRIDDLEKEIDYFNSQNSNKAESFDDLLERNIDWWHSHDGSPHFLGDSYYTVDDILEKNPSSTDLIELNNYIITLDAQDDTCEAESSLSDINFIAQRKLQHLANIPHESYKDHILNSYVNED